MTPAPKQHTMRLTTNHSPLALTQRIAGVTALALLTACASTPLPPWPTGGLTRSSPEVPPSPPVATKTPPAVPRASAHPVETRTIEPIAPLPYSEAVAARFPEPSVRYETPGLAAQHNAQADRWTSNTELATWLQTQSVKSLGTNTRLGVVTIGESQRGTPIPMLVATQGDSIDASSSNLQSRPSVLLVAQQHGDEPAGAEALLIIARELAPGGLLEPLLSKLNVLIVARANPDGAEKAARLTTGDIDINRDYLQLQTPEAQAITKVLRQYRPMVVVDLHEYDPITPYLSKFEALARHDALVQYAATPNVHEFVTKSAREWFAPELQAAWQKENLSSDWYSAPATDPQDKRLIMGSTSPESLRNISGLDNAVGLLIESRGKGLGRTHAQRRVHTHVTAASQVLQTAAAHASQLQQIQNFVARDIASKACHGQMPISTQQTAQKRDVTMLDPATGNDMVVPTDWLTSMQLQPSQTRQRACGYWLSASSVNAVNKLRALGLQVQKVAEPGQLIGESFQTTTSNGAHKLVATRGAVDATEGSYYISLAQPLAQVASAALEPGTPYSYVTAGVLTSTGDMARVMTPPSVVFDDGEQ
jgi:hypothetical protein